MRTLWSDLKNLYQKKPFLFLGEVHGFRANAEVIKLFAQKLKPRAVFFELPQDWNNLVSSYLQSDYPTRALNEFFKDEKRRQKLLDGRLIPDHLHLLRFLERKRIRIFCIDGDKKGFIHKNWNLRDKAMAQNIFTITQEKKFLPCLVVTGNLHARKHSFSLQERQFKSGDKPFLLAVKGRKFKPAGSYFKKQGIFVLIRYGKGEYFNYGVRRIRNKEVLRMLPKGRVYYLLPSKDPLFDYEILIRESKHAKLIVLN